MTEDDAQFVDSMETYWVGELPGAGFDRLCALARKGIVLAQAEELEALRAIERVDNKDECDVEARR